MKKLLVCTAILLLCSIAFLQASQKVTKEVLGQHNGNEVCLYTLVNKAGNVLKLTNYGARIVRIEVPDKNGNKDNVTTGSEKVGISCERRCFWWSQYRPFCQPNFPMQNLRLMALNTSWRPTIVRIHYMAAVMAGSPKSGIREL